MKTQSQIEKQLSELFFSLQDAVTSYAKISRARALIVSFSASLADVWNEFTQTKRKLFPQTATGDDLDVVLNQIGITRRGAVALSTVCVFGSTAIQTGESSSVALNALNDTSKTFTEDAYIGWVLYDSAGTQFDIASNTATQIVVDGTPAAGIYYVLPVVPAGTAVLSNVSGTRYLTSERVVVGLNNPALAGKTKSISLGNRSVVTCELEGGQGKARANELTVLETSIPGVTSVTNPIPTQPRTSTDAESDDSYRKRASLYFASLDRSISTLVFTDLIFTSTSSSTTALAASHFA